MKVFSLCTLLLAGSVGLGYGQTAAEPEAQPPVAVAVPRPDLTARMSALILPDVAFLNTKLPECVTWFRAHGVPLEFAPAFSEQRKQTKITLRLKKPTAESALKFLAGLVAAELTVSDQKITLHERPHQFPGQ